MTNTIDVGADGRFAAFVFAALGPTIRWLMGRQVGKELHALRSILEGSDDVDPERDESGTAGA